MHVIPAFVGGGEAGGLGFQGHSWQQGKFKTSMSYTEALSQTGKQEGQGLPGDLLGALAAQLHAGFSQQLTTDTNAHSPLLSHDPGCHLCGCG